MEPFSVTIEVRVYELDTQGHLNSAVYHQYAEHVRWKYLERLGIAVSDLLAARVGPAFLEETIRYQRELRAGDAVTIGCRFDFPEGGGKTFRIEQPFTAADGAPVAHLTSVCGLMDLDGRKLVADPLERLAGLAREGAFA